MWAREDEESFLPAMIVLRAFKPDEGTVTLLYPPAWLSAYSARTHDDNPLILTRSRYLSVSLIFFI